METVIAAAITGGAAIITAVLTLVGVIITVKKNNDKLMSELDKRSEMDDQKLDAKLEKFTAVTDTKIDELTREVRKHNEFAERIPRAETNIENLFRLIGNIKNDGR